MAQRRALITGASGQDGTYLSRLLLAKDYAVYGLDAPGHVSSVALTDRREFDLRDQTRLTDFVREVRPDEVYHLAAHHRSSAARVEQVDESAEEQATLETNLLAVHTILRTLHTAQPNCRVFLAGSCHMFGEAQTQPQNEQTPFVPSNIYGITKTAATHLGRFYRAQHKMFVCTGILFNHESPLRSPDFVTARIVKAAVEIAHGLGGGGLALGNLNALVDWGFAGDYVEAMWLMQQAEVPEDFVIASGELHSVREFVALAFSRVGLDWIKYVREDASLYRPVSQTVYHGDASLIRQKLGWQPRTTFKELVEIMVDERLGKITQ